MARMVSLQFLKKQSVRFGEIRWQYLFRVDASIKVFY